MNENNYVCGFGISLKPKVKQFTSEECFPHKKKTLVLVVGMARNKGTLLKCGEMAILCCFWGSPGIGEVVRTRV